MENSYGESSEYRFQLSKDNLITYNRADIIGWGSFSFIFKGKIFSKKDSQKEISIKEIKLQSEIECYDEISYETTVNEVNILKSLKHKNTLKLIGFHEIPKKKMVLVTKCCNQGDLVYFMSKFQFISQDSLMYFFTQIMNGFKYLYSHNIFHRDIKPENIFLHNDKIKIADYGFAKKMKNRSEQFHEIKGSPGYMSPEIMNGEPYTCESDVWSLGVTLYYMIYEKLPWGDMKNPIKLGKFLREKHKNNEDIVNFPETWRFFVSSELKSLIRKMITYDVKERIKWTDLLKDKTIGGKDSKVNKQKLKLLYKAKSQFNEEKALLENYCSPSVLIDSGGKNFINSIRVSEYANKCAIQK